MAQAMQSDGHARRVSRLQPQPLPVKSTLQPGGRTVVIALALAFAHQLLAADEHLSATEWSRRALIAAEAGDGAEFLRAARAAERAEPGHPRHRYNLACALVRVGELEAALDVLEDLATAGLNLPVAGDPDFSPLHDSARFTIIAGRYAANAAPRGALETAFELPAQTGLVEGITHDPASDRFFFGDVFHRAIWARSAAGELSRFSTADERLGGFFGLTVDPERQLLWAASAWLPQVESFNAERTGTGGLAAFDLATGALKKWIPLKGSPGDLVRAPDGTLYATDSASGTIWRLRPKDDAASTWRQVGPAGERHSLQGMAILPGGAWLLIADYPRGLVFVPLQDEHAEPMPLVAPPDVVLTGLDGLYVTGDRVIGLQNGVRPTRVIALDFTPPANANFGPPDLQAVTELAAGHATMPDPTLGVIVGPKFYFIGDPGWNHFPAAPASESSPRPVPVLRVSLHP